MAKKVNMAELAKKYASALFDEAVTRGDVDTVAAEMRDLSRLMAESPEFAQLMASRLIGEGKRASALAVVFEQAGLSDVMRGFFGVLSENGRLSLFDKIVPAFTALYEEYKGILPVYVVAAQALNEGTHNHLVDVLKKIFNKDIRLNVTVDPSLIGGLTVRVGSFMADASVQTKLQKLNHVLKGVGV